MLVQVINNEKDFRGGYRDIKLNIVFHSSINVGVSMVCEVQLLLNQYLHEKKRIHKLYSIVRQKEYFKMVVTEETDTIQKELKDLEFKATLDVSTIVGITSKLRGYTGKCSIDQSMGLLAVESRDGIVVIDINRKKMVFSEKVTQSGDSDESNLHSHCWMDIDNKKYLSVQTSDNIITFFNINKVTDDEYKCEEDETLRICLGETDTINCCEFDETFENIIIVKNCNTLEKRAVKNSNNVSISIELEKEIRTTNLKILSLS
eukprot:41838_1